ncbi:T9SS type B sorting domain-containing protein [Olleya sp. YS]|uniref:T9SS type B sorting domain-containing protein n=1 Tax=Olleya sp. YS TaxID=3028318 RepID=UPI0024342AB2|nr:T9SS type B sorting domain-containing protein [Olleya sp. YS]WGD33955.1 T9SS type B sorting domain-containing protein [Olleya sp. YS]
MKKILLIVTLLCSYSFVAQNEAANWYFGNNAGINFDTNTNAVTAVLDGQLATDEGCTSISDGNGDLLFYTDGITVYNQNHAIMPNGNSLKGNPSSTQSAIIIPKPADSDIYYIFTVDTEFQNTTDEGFHFSEVDMTLDGGLGDVTSNKNINLLANTSEKLSAVLKDCQSENIWVITLADQSGGENNNTFYAYEVTATGVNTTPVVSAFPNLFITERRGYLKLSPDGTKIACANIGEGLYLFDFDTATGLVSNPEELNINISPQGKPQSSYGIEFSPNNNLLYVTTYYQTPQNEFNDASSQYGALLQYDLTAGDINAISASEQVIDERIMYRSALQLGPDGKIYRTLSATYTQGTPFLSVINNPNNIGQGAGYQHAVIDLLNRNARQGLPPFISSFFSEKIDIIPTDTTNTVNLPLCIGEDYTLIAEDIPGATYTWTQDEMPIPTPAVPNELLINADGNYEVLIDLNNGDCDTKEGQAIVTYYEVPVATQPNNIVICDDDNDATSSFDFSTQDMMILDGQDASVFSIQYYSSQADADLDQNQLPNPYTNTNAQEPIFARIFNSQNPNCYDTTSFNIEVYNTPTIGTLTDFVDCDDTSDGDDTNGQTTIDLSSYNTEVYNGQNTMLYDISYHNSQIDADTGNNPLPNNYYNTTPINETIFVRLENVNNATCFDTGSFTITINPVPEAFDALLFQCDEDGISDGFTTFNLTEAIPDLTNNAADRTVEFYDTLAEAQTETNPINGNAYSNASNPQVLYAVVANSITGCTSISELTLEVSSTQTNDYVAPPVCDELGSEDGINTFNLNDFSTDMLAGLPADITISYYETYNDALLETNALPTLYDNTTPYSQIIYARAENDNACYGINEVLLTINPLPELSNDETIIYCLNEFPTTIELTASNPINNNYFYNWSTGETTATIEVNSIGSYTVTATTVEGCSKTKTIVIEPSNIATIEDIQVIDGSLTNNLVTVIVSGEGEYQFELVDAEGVSSGFQTSNVFTFVKPGIYSVNVRDIKNNCGTVDQLFSVIGFPLYFTPNNDGQNDYWQVYGVSTQFQPNSVIQIFDRYGKLLKEFTPSSLGWDGTFNGLPMPTNDYWFSVKLQDGRIYKSHFTLKR